jgi:hypothetical protein
MLLFAVIEGLGKWNVDELFTGDLHQQVQPRSSLYQSGLDGVLDETDPESGPFRRAPRVFICALGSKRCR